MYKKNASFLSHWQLFSCGKDCSGWYSLNYVYCWFVYRLYKNKKYTGYYAGYGWYCLNYVYIFKSIKKCCKLIISLLLLLIVFWTTFQLLLSVFDLLNISWFIRQAFQMIRTTRSFKQSVVYLIAIYVLRCKTIYVC